MRDRTKLVVAAAALAAAVIAVQPAEAGNLPTPQAQYFSVAMQAGQYFEYTGTQENATLLVDDITYTAQINPCELYERCDYFTAEEIAGTADESVIWQFDPPSSSIGTFGGEEISTHFRTRFTSIWMQSKGEYLGAYLVESGEEDGSIFDGFTHTVYGTLAGKYKNEKESSTMTGTRGSGGFSSNTTHKNTDGVVTGTSETTGVLHVEQTYATATATHAMSEALAVSTWAVPTSESRHYQTPQIVQDGRRVSLILEIAAGDYGSYTNAICYVKGRVLFGTTGIPTENVDVTVHTP